jgi:hypothetical protein
MSQTIRRTLVLTAALLLAAGSVHAAPAAATKQDSATTIALRKIADRYTLTKSRIAVLLDARMHPPPLPTSLPNPFYHAAAVPVTETEPAVPVETAVVPAAADSSDADTLARFAASIKVSGVVIMNGQPRLTLNQTLCKVGDVIPMGGKDHAVYIQVLRITADELTLGLNQAEQTIRLKK